MTCSTRAISPPILPLTLFLASLSTAHSVAHAEEVPQVQFRFFDEAGRELDQNQIVSRMTNGTGIDHLSSGTFNLDTLKALYLSPVENSGPEWIVPFRNLDQNPKQGYMVHWSTENTGYSTFLLDNEGQGFTQSDTVIFNERLAWDAKRQFDISLDKRPDYTPSAEMITLQSSMEDCFNRLDAAQSDSLRGGTGQVCTDLVAQAMTLLLREYGTARARQLDMNAVWGVTITPRGSTSLPQEQAKLDDLADLFAPAHRWARIRMSGSQDENLDRIAKIVAYAGTKSIRTMGQLFDSSSQAEIPLDLFKSRVDAAVRQPGFEKFDAWEVGNEVNGQWLGNNVPEKIAYAAKTVRSAFPGKMSCLTFYWYSMEHTRSNSLFNWIDANITPEIRDSIDCVTISIYTNQQPLGFSWDLVMNRLAEVFPGKKVMLGETAFADPTEKVVFREGRLDWDLRRGTREYIMNRYAASFATLNSIGGGFWWYYDREMAGKTPYWHDLRDLYCSVYPAQC